MQQLTREDGYSYLWQSLRQQRSVREYEDVHLARYVRPSLSPGYELTPLDKPAISYLWDDTAIKANELFGRSLWSIVHSASVHWFEYKPPKSVEDDQESIDWCADVVTDDLRTEFEDGNLYLALLLRLYDVGSHGYGAVYSYEDPDRPGHLSWEWVPAPECFFVLNGKGQCIKFVRPMNLTAHQLVHEIGIAKEDLDAPIQTAYVNKNHAQKFLFLHIVEARNDAKRRPTSNLEMAWRGVYFYPGAKKIHKEHGYADMPYHVLTWGGSRGNPYPISIGYTTLPEIRNINSTRKRFDRLLELETENITLGPDGGEQPGGDQARPQPGDYISGGMSGDGKRLYDLLYAGNGGRTTQVEVAASRQIIQDAYHNQLFMMQTQRQMTAEEVRSRDAKIIQALGPFIVFLGADADTIIDRTFNYRIMQGAYDPVPASLGPQDSLQLKYHGLLAQAQEALQGQQIFGLLNEAAFIMQMGNDAAEAVNSSTDWGAAYRHLARSKAVPSDVVFSREKAIKNQEKRAAAQSSQQMAAMAPELAKAANDGAGAMEKMARAEQTITSGGLA